MIDDDSLWSEVSNEIAGEFVKPKSLGALTINSVDVRLSFPEKNAIKMTYSFGAKYTVDERTRFVERQYQWSGHGVHGRPRVFARVDGETVPARLHGPTWTERKVSSFLIDLSRTVQPGSSIEISVDQSFVDESEIFIPYLSHRNFHEYDFKMSVAFARAPSSCAYSFEPADPSEPTDRSPISLESLGEVDGPFESLFEYVPSPADRGIHKITWEK